MLVRGGSVFHYADKVYEVKKQALSFSNPMIPYKWEHLDKIREGVYRIFTNDFFRQFGQFYQYEVFQPQGIHIFELPEEQARQVEDIYRRIEQEFNSEYKYQYDLIRKLVFELILFGLKIQPASNVEKQPINASQRIANLFTELLERQFPIEESHTHVQLRTASDFANQLYVHVNHLNRAVKETIQKTTS